MKNKKLIIYLSSLVAVVLIATVGYNLLIGYVDTKDSFGGGAEDVDQNEQDSNKEDEVNDNKEDGSEEDLGYPEAVDFTFYDYNGDAVSLSDYYGKPIVLNFWASWCGPCRDEMPDLEEAYLEYGEDVEFLLVNATDGSRETEEIAREFIDTGEGADYTFPVYFDLDIDGAITYGVNSLPTTYVINKDAEIVAYAKTVISNESLAKVLDELLLEE